MKIKDLIIANGYSIENIHENILNHETQATEVIETDIYSPVVGYELHGENNIVYTINLEENEFAPFVKAELDGNNYYAREIGYDNNLEVIYDVEH